MVLRRHGPPPFEVMRKLRSEQAQGSGQRSEPPQAVAPEPQAQPAPPAQAAVEARRERPQPPPPVAEVAPPPRRQVEVEAPPALASRPAPSISAARIDAEPTEAAPAMSSDAVELSPQTDTQQAPADEESWLLKAKQPMVLRVPQGILVAGVVGLLIVIGMVYWAGRSRGYRGAVADSDAGPLMGAVSPVPVNPDGTPAALTGSAAQSQAAGSPSSARDTAADIAAARRAGVDARVAGRNYFVLAYYPKEQAEKLVTFLSSQGVDAAAIRGNNRRDFQVIALRGFDKSDLASTERREYERQLKQVGRAWKERQRGATDLSDMYPDRFDGEPIAQILYP